MLVVADGCATQDTATPSSHCLADLTLTLADRLNAHAAVNAKKLLPLLLSIRHHLVWEPLTSLSIAQSKMQRAIAKAGVSPQSAAVLIKH